MTTEKAPLNLKNLGKNPYFSLSPNLRIKPNFPEVESESFSFFITSMEQLIESILPDSIRDQLLYQENEEKLRKAFSQLTKILPIFSPSIGNNVPSTIAVASFCLADYTEGVGRYIGDMLSRWLIPGKQLTLVGNRSLAFTFVKYPQQEFFLNEYLIAVKEKSELEIIRNNISSLLSELRVTILAVYYARYIVSISSLSLEQKTTMIQENISSLLDSPAKIKESNIFDQMQQFLIKLSAEEKFHQVKQNITHLFQSRPKAFDRDVFYEIRHFMNAFRDKFTASRDPRHISRVIAFQYLFKKSILAKVENEPQERHLSLKLLKTHVDGKKVLGLLITIHLLKETERFDKEHIVEAISAIVGKVDVLGDSFISERSDDAVRSYYIEIEMNKLTFEDIKKLKKDLHHELKARVENVVHPIFMPRNEEEIMRNIIVLHKQIRFVRDLPQAIITYDKQLGDELSFQVILVRVIKENSAPLENLLEQHQLAFTIDEVKSLGYLKRKHPKEAIVFHVFLHKKSFFRKDFSLDLHKARNQVVRNLIRVIGEFRDYNGGMIVKQNEALEALRLSLRESGLSNDFLLENFFYAIRPGFMQSIIETKILHELFNMLLAGMQSDFDTCPVYFVSKRIKRYLLIMICSPKDVCKEVAQKMVASFNIPSGDLVTCSINTYELSSFGIIYRSNGSISSFALEMELKKALHCT